LRDAGRDAVEVFDRLTTRVVIARTQSVIPAAKISRVNPSNALPALFESCGRNPGLSGAAAVNANWKSC
jgi:hypothetical protein